MSYLCLAAKLVITPCECSSFSSKHTAAAFLLHVLFLWLKTRRVLIPAGSTSPPRGLSCHSNDRLAEPSLFLHETLDLFHEAKRGNLKNNYTQQFPWKHASTYIQVHVGTNGASKCQFPSPCLHSPPSYKGESEYRQDQAGGDLFRQKNMESVLF